MNMNGRRHGVRINKTETNKCYIYVSLVYKVSTL